MSYPWLLIYLSLRLLVLEILWLLLVLTRLWPWRRCVGIGLLRLALHLRLLLVAILPLSGLLSLALWSFILMIGSCRTLAFRWPSSIVLLQCRGSLSTHNQSKRGRAPAHTRTYETRLRARSHVHLVHLPFEAGHSSRIRWLSRLKLAWWSSLLLLLLIWLAGLAMADMCKLLRQLLGNRHLLALLWAPLEAR